MADGIGFLFAPDAASFWEIQRHFLERTLNINALNDVLLVVGGLAGAVLCIMLFLHFRPRKKHIPQDWVLAPEKIREMLNTALTQRARFELCFAAEGEEQRPVLRCSIQDFSPDGILLETSGPTSLSSRWEGKEADCFFMIRRQGSYAFFAFTTTIKSIRMTPNACLIRISIPQKIESRQKRSYLRINPPEEYMLGAALWRGGGMPDEDAMTDLALWSRPSRIFLPGTQEDFSIKDISSGGLKLHLARHILEEEMDMVHVSNRFIVMLDLWEPDTATRLRFWLLCRIQNSILNVETKGMDIGVQFLAWAKPAEPGASTLLWLKLASSGEVEPLGNWIMRRHLEFFRDSEQFLGFAQGKRADA